jgi:hypothetical protein
MVVGTVLRVLDIQFYPPPGKTDGRDGRSADAWRALPGEGGPEAGRAAGDAP